ncbi:MAG: branched-chain amino acid ABC transporter permease [Alcaligenaceae bacterium]|jgi:branched-chain amino acid transport system permease protein|uniref:branched-chain amino acid ABC transporter permease n=1 Tax=Advenella alkanexedens TaxID=1481665 RepID=UPI0016912B10|nr:branched-chain amino acid ABC transporter permease [Advenella alkanexedens]NLN68160.1 branched-chain amino acid ABC transporter permease [Alcaligenaceae bacterium]NLY34016.1 branched-chain amino acid ABC transporter permease [Alcaligenaceae bacterium]WKU20528.1 branched-chain amino acid ABC transporter permease [Advenella alkanexedens]
MDFDWLFFVEISLGGLGTGGLYALTALAFVIIFKSTGVVNLAIGEMLMVGAYLVYGLATGFGLPIWLAIIVGVLGSGLAGGVIERLAIRPMVGESPISTFMITVGLASVLVGAVELIWTADQRRMPPIMPDEAIFIGEAFVSSKVFYGFFVTLILISLGLLVFRFWRGGVALRATAFDQGAAYSMGINVPRVFSLSWVIGAMIATVAGVIVGAIGGISPSMGIFGLSVLVVVIAGGLDSVLGALVAGMAIGLIEAWASGFLGGEYKVVVTFLILIIVLMIRPYGLFGTREIERL